jgi:hypothetical protein
MGDAIVAGGAGWVWRACHIGRGRGFAGEELHVARFFCAGLAREYGGERRLALAEAVERGDDVVEGFEAVHAFGTAAEFAGSLRAAEEKHAENGDLAAIEVENFLEAVLVFGDAAVGTAGWTGETFFLKRGERVTDGIFIEGRHGIAIIFLIAGVDQSVQREGIVIGRGNVFFDERAENADFDVSERIHEVDCNAAERCDERVILRGGRGDVIGLA